MSLLFPGGWLAVIWAIKPHEYRQLLAFGWLAGAGFLLLAAVLGVASWGCFHRRRWGWLLAVILIGINAAGDAARVAMGELVEGMTGVVIASALLWWLTRDAVRARFG
jgi:hypothetical protein